MAQGRSAAGEGRSPTNLQYPSVLLAEDDAALRRILGMTLREGGFATIDVGTGGEALDVLSRLPLGAVVLDLDLPDGLSMAVAEGVTRLQAGGGRAPALLVMSALSLEEAVEKYGPLPSQFLAKPFDPWELVRLLSGLLSAGG